MESLSIQRTPAIIAAEINSIKNQTMQMILCNSIEIGNRLIEAKGMLEHGEWGKWLESSVNYSQRTANNLMRIAEEYGADQFALFGANAKSQALANLSYTQAVALLGVPEEEREQFVEEHDVENMSTRELQQAIKERDEAIIAKDAAENRYKNVSSRFDKLEKAHDEEASRLKKEIAKIEIELAKAKESGNPDDVRKLNDSYNLAVAELKISNQKIEDLERQLKEQPIDVPATVEKIPEEVEKELAELRAKAGQDQAVVKFKVIFDDLVKDFNDLLTSLAGIPDPETKGKFKEAVSGLISRMQERL
jgi:hypothetical protein